MKNKDLCNKDLLIEIGCEDLPARFLKSLAIFFFDELKANLTKANFNFKSHQTFITPRRLAVLCKAINVNQPTKIISKQGPSIKIAFDENGKPTKVANGFAKSNNIDLKELQQKNGNLYCSNKVIGKTINKEFGLILATTLQNLKLPAKMRYDNNCSFIRPIRWFCCMLDDQIIDFELFNLKSSDNSFAHRFMADNKKIKIKQANDYEQMMQQNFVIADFEKRKQKILAQFKELEKKYNFIISKNNRLLDEVNSLLEYPVAIVGKFPQKFTKLPKEVLIISMTVNQKYFYVENKQGILLNQFIAVANIVSQDKKKMIKGYEKVLLSRLQDAEFFITQDLKYGMKQFAKSLKKVTFFEHLGNLEQKQKRIINLAKFITKSIPNLIINQHFIEQAASFLKVDLSTELVYEFPELQGVAGRIYLLKENFASEVAYAVEEHYQPKTEQHDCPKSIYGKIFAISDKVDTLVGLFGIGKKSSGDKDPLALRRIAMGLLKLGAELKFDLPNLIIQSNLEYKKQKYNLKQDLINKDLIEFCFNRYHYLYFGKYDKKLINASISTKFISLFDFPKQIELVNIINHDKSMMQAINRMNNFLTKNKDLQNNKIDIKLFENQFENNLYELICDHQQFILDLENKSNFDNYLIRIKKIVCAVNDFFDNVFINSENQIIKNNRLQMLIQTKQWFDLLADFSQLK